MSSIKQISKFSGALFLTILIVLIFQMYTSMKPAEQTLASIQTQPQKDTDIYQCQQNSDCVSVISQCCTCNEGGKKTAINRQYYTYWINQQNDSCLLTSCPNIKSTDISCTSLKPECINDQCQMN